MRERTGNHQGVERLAFSVPEFAVAAGIGRSLAYELIKRGEIKSFRIGRRVVIPREAVEQWLREKLNA